MKRNTFLLQALLVNVSVIYKSLCIIWLVLGAQDLSTHSQMTVKESLYTGPQTHKIWVVFKTC